jgi:aldose 1-epimerase
MNFQINEVSNNGIQLIELVDPTTKTTVSIAPEFGAMLHQFSIQFPDGDINIIDNYSSLNNIQEELALSYKSSKLSPFPCRIPEGKYVWQGQLYEFPDKFVDGSAIHGILFNKSFTVISKEVNEFHASVLLEYHYDGTNPGYPFSYSCQIRYSLFPGNTLQLLTNITNTSNQEIPIADGWHPYFQLGGKIDELTLKFPSQGMVEFDEKLIPTGNIIPFNKFNEENKLAETVLDNCFLLEEKKANPTAILRNPANGLSLEITTDNQYDYLQIYTPPHRNSIAIENLSGAPNCFQNKMGLILLPPNETKKLVVHYKVTSKKN